MELLTETEEERLIMNLAYSREGSYFTEEEGARVIEWARQVRTDGALLELALDGKAWIEVTPDLELRFRADVSGRLAAALDSAFNES